MVHRAWIRCRCSGLSAYHPLHVIRRPGTSRLAGVCLPRRGCHTRAAANAAARNQGRQRPHHGDGHLGGDARRGRVRTTLVGGPARVLHRGQVRVAAARNRARCRATCRAHPSRRLHRAHTTDSPGRSASGWVSRLPRPADHRSGGRARAWRTCWLGEFFRRPEG